MLERRKTLRERRLESLNKLKKATLHTETIQLRTLTVLINYYHWNIFQTYFIGRLCEVHYHQIRRTELQN